ncbi:MAG: hypothetical protein AAB452_00235 [Patescibacteria group bacterium]
MPFLKKIWATLASYNQRPDPNTANQDLREEATKHVNQEKEREALDQERMRREEETRQAPEGTEIA